jgi:hypothetical protein
LAPLTPRYALSDHVPALEFSIYAHDHDLRPVLLHMTFLTITTSAAPNIAGIFDALHEKIRSRAPDVEEQIPHLLGWYLLAVSLTSPEPPIVWAGLWDDVHAALAPLDSRISSIKTPCMRTSVTSKLDNFSRRSTLHARRRHDPGQCLHPALSDVGEGEVLRMRSLFAPVLRTLPLPVHIGCRRVRMAFMARHDCWRLSFPLPRLQGLSPLLLSWSGTDLLSSHQDDELISPCCKTGAAKRPTS